jgi:Kdo2-lipid IVA lauroyltransferase/acyltransferase
MRRFLTHCRHRAEYLAFRLFTTALDLVGPRTAVVVSEWLAIVCTRIAPPRWTRSDVARANVRRAFPEASDERVETIVRGMYAHFLLLLVEIAQAGRKLRRDNCLDFCDWAGDWAENERLLKESGRPVIEIGGHLGNWEVGSVICALDHAPMGVVARTLDNPLLDAWFRRLRERGGNEFLSKNDDFERMVEILESGGRLGMLCDQDAGHKGVFVPFLGKPASTFRSIALLAIQYRAFVCVGYCCRVPNDLERDGWFRFELGCETIIDATEYDGRDGVERLTARYTAALEAIVRRFPEQYFWLHRRWKTAPGTRRHAVRRAA